MFGKKNGKRSSSLRKKKKQAKKGASKNPILSLLYEMQEKIREDSDSPSSLMEDLHAQLEHCLDEKDDQILSDAILQLDLEGKESLAFWMKWTMDDLVQKGEGDFGDKGELTVYLFGIPVLLKAAKRDLFIEPIPLPIRDELTHSIEEAPFLPSHSRVALSPFWVDGSYGGFPWSQMREMLYLLSDIISGERVEDFESIVREIGFGGEPETVVGAFSEEEPAVAIRFLMGALAVPLGETDMRKGAQKEEVEEEGGLHSFPTTFQNTQYLEWSHQVSRILEHDKQIDQVLVLSPPAILSDSIFQGYMTFKSLDFNNDVQEILDQTDPGDRLQCTYHVAESDEGDGREIRIGIFDGKGVFLGGHIWPLDFWENEEDGVMLLKEVVAGTERFQVWDHPELLTMMDSSSGNPGFLRPPAE
ncbi:MAG: hypothetical protein ACYC9S_02850 [Leptospirales bacterium]